MWMCADVAWGNLRLEKDWCVRWYWQPAEFVGQLIINCQINFVRTLIA